MKARGCAFLLACVGVALTLGLGSLLANSVPSFAPPRNYATDRGPSAIAINDLNADGRRDLATANPAPGHTVSVLLNTGGGTFRARRDYQTGGTLAVTIGDLNGDRKPDLATANDSPASTVSILLNRGDGSFLAKVDYPTGDGPSPSRSAT